MSEAPLQIRGASRSFGNVRALVEVDLDLAPGELMVLVGPSGCGKSTLLRAIAGLEPLDQGTITVDGEVLTDGRHAVAPERRPVGLVFQDHALFPHLTIADNVGFGLRKIDKAQRRAQVDHLLEMVGIAHLRDRYPHEVSGGERQRASVVRAAAPKPALLLLDEPFAALDPNLRTQVRTELVALLRETGTPAVFVSHDQAEALALGDRVAVMRAGRLEQVGSGPEIYDHPVNRFVAGFMGEASFLPVTAQGEGWCTELGPIDTPAEPPGGGDGRELLAVIRPADVELVVDSAGTGEVIAATYQGPTWHYEVRLPSGLTIGASVPRITPIAVGTKVTVTRPGTSPALVAADEGTAS